MININTSELIKYKKAIIDGAELGFRVLSSAETLEILELQEQVKTGKVEQATTIKRLLEIVFSACDQPERAKEILAGLAFDAVLDIYRRVIESE